MKLSQDRWIHLYSELSNFVLEYSSLDPVWTEDENGDEVMTEDKQDEFCYIADNVEQIMSRCGLVKEDNDGV